MLFRLEQRHSAEQFEQLIEAVLGWFRRHKGFEPLKRLFGELVRQAMQSLESKGPIPHDLVEMQCMLATQGEVWKQEWLAEGRAEGRIEGKVDAAPLMLAT